MATLKDIAQQVGISVQAASAALRADPTSARVSAELRERVQRVARELGYQPNRLAQGLARGRSYTFGVLLPGIASPPCALAASGAEEEAAAAGYSILLCNTRGSAELERRHLDACARARVEGIVALFSSQVGSPDTALELASPGVPLVAINRELRRPGFHSILMDNRRAARAATEHLIERGHRRIVYLAWAGALGDGDPPDPSYVERHAGYLDAMAAARLEPVFTQHRGDREADQHVPAARECAGALLDGAHPPTAFFGTTDYEAVGVLAACTARGLRVPQDVAIQGFDDTEVGRWSTPPISTVRQPFHEAGRLAVHRLLKWQDGFGPSTTTLRCDLVPRDSTGARVQERT